MHVLEALSLYSNPKTSSAGDRSLGLSLALGSKEIHLTLADRATKELPVWKHLRNIRARAREQAKASP